MQAVLIVFGHLPLALSLAAHLLQPLFLAEAVVCRAALHQFLGIFLIDLLPLTLDIRAKLPAHIRAFIVVKPGIAQRAVDDLAGFIHQAVPIRILDAQDELPAVFSGIEPGIKRRPQPADMQIAGGAGGESRSDCHNLLRLSFHYFCKRIFQADDLV